MNTLLPHCLSLAIVSVAFLITSGQSTAKADEIHLTKNHENPEKEIVITKSDEKYIKWNAERVVGRFMDLLNFIATSQGLEISEVDNIIHQSFTQADGKLFYDSASVVEDDLYTATKDNKSKEKLVLRYLKDFDLLYKKTSEGSVAFSNFRVSNIKSKDYLYIKVFYDCLFKNKSRITDQPYYSQKRVAELKIERSDNTWKSWITNVYFTDSLDLINASRNDVIIKENPSADKDSRSLFVVETPAKVIENKDENISKSKKTPEELYTYYMKEALFAESIKKYNDALSNYQSAIFNKPDEKIRLSKKINELKTRLDNTKAFDEKYEAGQYKDAIVDYDNAIRKDGNNPDYYFGRAKCYVKTGDYNLAIKDYDKAIKIDPSYVQAYKMKGAVYEMQESYQDAITNYETCALIEKNNITLYHKIASLYVTLGNYNAAIESFDKAILANDKTAFLFNLRGELLYKSNKFTEAESDFNSAISLDSTKAMSYFYRGLCRFDLKNTDQAASDFARAKELNLETRYIQRIPQVNAGIYKANNQ